MVLGFRGKNRRNSTVQIDYLILIEEIKPWPPTQSLRSLRSVLLQWGNGERSSGSTNIAVPSLGSVIGEGKIEFNELFNLNVTLLRDMSVRGGNADVFQKNCLEFNLYEPRRDKAVKGQLLGTAVIDLAEYGMLKESLSISVPLNCKRNYRNTDQPLLFIKIQPVEKNGSLKSGSKENIVGDSVLELMNEEYSEEAEIASFTDDDISSHSSVAAVTSSQNTGMDDKKYPLGSGTGIEKSNIKSQDTYKKLQKSSPHTSSVDVSSDLGSPLNGQTSVNSHHSSVRSQKHVASSIIHRSSKSLVLENLDENPKNKTDTSYYDRLNEDVQINADTKRNEHEDGPEMNNKLYKGCEEAENYHGNEVSNLCEQYCKTDEQSVTEGVEDQIPQSTSVYTLDEANIGFEGNSLKSERFLKHVKSVRSPTDSTLSIGSPGSDHHAEVKGAGTVGDVRNTSVSEKKDAKVYPKEARTSISVRKINLLEGKVKILEGELREAAAIEVALYSVVVEHGSSMSKIHAPARRLSRLYLHACKENVQARRAGAAKSAVSGLILVAKACGNDVSRLTFWLSNAIVLRTIISQTTKNVAPSDTTGPSVTRKNGGELNDKISPSLLRWKGSSPRKNENTTVGQSGFDNWDDPLVYTSALEKVEAWIFSRIVESIWWQIMTPHMQHVDAKVTKKNVGSSSWKPFGKLSSSIDHEQGKFSQDIWKNAFGEAYEKLCPIRAGGHECGCLPVLSGLIMEQCVARLDVAMFNAILRESAEEIPTDPVSDPISDPNVLPIPLGRLSFGAGVQLKSVIGNWSRWLTDLFGIDDDDSLQDNDDSKSANNEGRQNITCKSFHLLNALSEVLMLPKDTLLGTSARKEVCPMFSSPVIRRVLNNFAPDEFCPDPIPTAVLEALDSQDDLKDGGECVKNVPCIATPIVYMPPPASYIASIIGEVGSESKLRSRSSVLRKAYASDDELDELNSPLSLISSDGFMSKAQPTKSNLKFKEIQNSSAVRYKLLMDVWANTE